ncbi:hypothetical protein [Thalassotalea sp. G20_0]|nr:hypothetical protein [Thalassotalea sp. G20_0]
MHSHAERGNENINSDISVPTARDVGSAENTGAIFSIVVVKQSG